MLGWKWLAGAGMMVVALGIGSALTGGTAAADEVVVYKSPYCGCCAKWVDHMRANGFSVAVREVEDVAPVKAAHGVAPSLESCHTAVVDGYVVEGHVPAGDVKRLLAERPRVRGLAVPGMPSGSPGMEGPTKDSYDVVAFDGVGRVSVFNRYPAR
ncbi:MAG: DUF411 domain-containing protein [Rhodospirillales bacterium]|nr:DUF411 domain-containing protein [Rhodospirillales bacterium]